MPRCVIGIDIGTTGVKAIALSERGRTLATAYHEHHLYSPRPGWAEENPTDWWRGTVVTLKHILAKVSPRSVSAIGVSGMVPALVLLDSKKRSLRPSIQQNDARTERELVWLRERIKEKGYLRRTGCAITQQLIPPKLLWIRTHEPEIYKQIRWIMGSYDYINYKLTSILSIEQNWAIESGLWTAEDRGWYKTILDLFEIPEEWLSPVHHPHEFIGETTKEVEKETGLRQGTPVIAGSADHIAAALASGISEKGDLVLKFGGAGDILYCLDHFAPHPQLFIDYHDIPGKYVISGCMASSGSVVKWFKNLLGGEENTYAELDRHAKKVDCGSEGLVILPYFIGEKTPIFDPLARGVVFGLSLHHTKYHIHRAILESVAYGFRHHVELIREMGYPIQRVLAVDQGARSDLWRQISADVLGTNIYCVQGGDLGSVYGTAFVIGVAMDFWEWKDIKKFSKVSLANHSKDENHKLYTEIYQIYLSLYRHLKEDFRHLYQIKGEG